MRAAASSTASATAPPKAIVEPHTCSQSDRATTRATAARSTSTAAESGTENQKSRPPLSS